MEIENDDLEFRPLTFEEADIFEIYTFSKPQAEYCLRLARITRHEHLVIAFTIQPAVVKILWSFVRTVIQQCSHGVYQMRIDLCKKKWSPILSRRQRREAEDVICRNDCSVGGHFQAHLSPEVPELKGWKYARSLDNLLIKSLREHIAGIDDR